jgi:hypothetical protein
MEKFLSHGLGCCPMEKSFSLCYHRLGCCLMDTYMYMFFFFAIDFDCRLMVVLVPMDLVVALWRISAPMDLVVVLWKVFCCSLDLVVVLKFLDLIKSWESSHRLNLIMSLLVAISLLICLIAFCFFLFVGVDDAVHVSEDVGELGITGEVTAVSPPPRPTIEAGSSVDVGSLSVKLLTF